MRSGYLRVAATEPEADSEGGRKESRVSGMTRDRTEVPSRDCVWGIGEGMPPQSEGSGLGDQT